MKVTTTLLSVFALCALILAGCTDNPADSSADKKGTLTADAWKTVSFKLNSADITSVSQKLTKFNTDGTMIATNQDGSTEPGTWEFNVDSTNIVVDKGTTTEINWNILTLTSSSLKLKSNATFQGNPWITEFEAVPE